MDRFDVQPSRSVERTLEGSFFKGLAEDAQQRARQVLREAGIAAVLPPEPEEDFRPPQRRTSYPLGRRTEAIGPSRLVRLFWLNLDRRPDRAEAQLEFIRRAKLQDLAERISAVNGLELDLNSVSESVLTKEGREQALNPPSFVLGRILTPGAVGLWLSWHAVLLRIAREARGEDECFLIVEDDAEYGEHFQERLADVFCLGFLRRSMARRCCRVYQVEDKDKTIVGRSTTWT